MKTRTPTPWSYTLPATSDPDAADVVTVTVTIPTEASSFLTFDASTNKLEIAELHDPDNTTIPIGSYVVDIVLSDGNGGTTSSQITLDIQEAPNNPPEFVTTPVAYHSLYKSIEQGSYGWAYTLPATTDLDTDDEVTKTFSFPAELTRIYWNESLGRL